MRYLTENDVEKRDVQVYLANEDRQFYCNGYNKYQSKNGEMFFIEYQERISNVFHCSVEGSWNDCLKERLCVKPAISATLKNGDVVNFNNKEYVVKKEE